MSPVPAAQVHVAGPFTILLYGCLVAVTAFLAFRLYRWRIRRSRGYVELPGVELLPMSNSFPDVDLPITDLSTRLPAPRSGRWKNRNVPQHLSLNGIPVRSRSLAEARVTVASPTFSHDHFHSTPNTPFPPAQSSALLIDFSDPPPIQHDEHNMDRPSSAPVEARFPPLPTWFSGTFQPFPADDSPLLLPPLSRPGSIKLDHHDSQPSIDLAIESKHQFPEQQQWLPIPRKPVHQERGAEDNISAAVLVSEELATPPLPVDQATLPFEMTLITDPGENEATSSPLLLELAVTDSSDAYPLNSIFDNDAERQVDVARTTISGPSEDEIDIPSSPRWESFDPEELATNIDEIAPQNSLLPTPIGSPILEIMETSPAWELIENEFDSERGDENESVSSIHNHEQALPDDSFDNPPPHPETPPPSHETSDPSSPEVDTTLHDIMPPMTISLTFNDSSQKETLTKDDDLAADTSGPAKAEAMGVILPGPGVPLYEPAPSDSEDFPDPELPTFDDTISIDSEPADVDLVDQPPRPAWSVRAADAPALGIATAKELPDETSISKGTPEHFDSHKDVAAPQITREPSLPGHFEEAGTTAVSATGAEVTAPEATPRRRLVRSPIDIALAMQLRPGLGIGADPAWMVRFLMAMFGWLTVLISGSRTYNPAVSRTAQSAH